MFLHSAQKYGFTFIPTSLQLHIITQILLHTPSSAMNVRNSLSSTRGCSRWSLDARLVAIRLSVLLQSCQKQQRRLFTMLSNTCRWFRGCTRKVIGQWPDEEAKSPPPPPFHFEFISGGKTADKKSKLKSQFSRELKMETITESDPDIPDPNYSQETGHFYFKEGFPEILL